MNLYRLELKRVCKTRMTAILLAIALVLTVVMAYLPVTFIGWTELDASGNKVSYTGLKAIRKRRSSRYPVPSRRMSCRKHWKPISGCTGSMVQAPSTISRTRYFIKNLPGISLL